MGRRPNQNIKREWSDLADTPLGTWMRVRVHSYMGRRHWRHTGLLIEVDETSARLYCIDGETVVVSRRGFEQFEVVDSPIELGALVVTGDDRRGYVAEVQGVYARVVTRMEDDFGTEESEWVRIYSMKLIDERRDLKRSAPL